MRVDKMDKRALYDQFHRVESRISSMGADVKEIQEKMDDLIERERKSSNREPASARSDRFPYEGKRRCAEARAKEMSKSRLNLQKLYEDGFHVCNVYYGSRRLNDEPCVFCIDVIYGEEIGKTESVLRWGYCQ